MFWATSRSNHYIRCQMQLPFFKTSIPAVYTLLELEPITKTRNYREDVPVGKGCKLPQRPTSRRDFNPQGEVGCNSQHSSNMLTAKVGFLSWGQPLYQLFFILLHRCFDAKHLVAIFIESLLSRADCPSKIGSLERSEVAMRHRKVQGNVV